MSEEASGGRRVLVIVPTFNESLTIAAVISRLFAAAGPEVELLVVDDGSPDGTAEIVRAAAVDNERVHLLERPAKSGLASAYLRAFAWGIEGGYQAIGEMDGDLSHDPAAVPELVRALEAADLVVGSRYVPGGGVENWSALRRVLSRGANTYARIWLGFPVRDSTSGFRMFRAEWLRAQDLRGVASEGYAFQIELARRVYRSGGRIVEVPIRFSERAAGKSKLSRTIVFEALVKVFAWGLGDRLRRPRSRVGASS